MYLCVLSCIHDLVFSSLNAEVLLPVERVVRSIFRFVDQVQVERSDLRAHILFVGNDEGRVSVVASIRDLEGEEISESALTHIGEAVLLGHKLLPLGVLIVVVRADRGVVKEGILSAELGFLVSQQVDGQSLSDPLLS